MDYGHGGRDAGYSAGSVKEKDLNLKIGQKVRNLLLKHDIEVCTTRDDDDFVPLDVRTSRVRDCKDAALLVSIHTNASSSKNVQGIETFYNHHTLFYNELSMGNDDIKDSSINFDKNINHQSKQLAELIHKNVLLNTAKINKKIIDRGIKNKAIQLLFGVEVPAVLIECGFLSHPVEGLLLADDKYQEKIAQGITKAIENFFDGQFA
ncbi:N-acetylmuramoyl-L-alanine amidase [bacterium]|nr:N-acetylmuramoyl-L-alanine amidase [bacterium]